MVKGRLRSASVRYQVPLVGMIFVGSLKESFFEFQSDFINAAAIMVSSA